ncbi:MAG: hypothetical protein HUU34_12730 [Saprospiraceae bacterium]|jgi:hypothetical protein|nr:hypothetical protein [Saprospiraceae bacterium]
MAILTILTLIVAVIGVVLLTQVMKLFQPGERKMQQEVNNMRLDMQKWVGELVPIDKKELELFSLSQIKQVLRKRWTTSAKGIFTTIYNEPIIAYSYKQFLGRGRHALLYARSASHEYAFWIRPKGVQVVIDNKLVGTYKDNTLLSAKSGKPIAILQPETQNSLLPVRINNREVGSLVSANPAAGKGLSQRAFEFLKNDITEEEETLLLALSVLELVNRKVE